MDNLYCWGTLVHEMAHVYTLSNGIAAHPDSAAIAHLYFNSFSDNLNCPSEELFADTVAFTVPTKGYILHTTGIFVIT